MCSSVVLMAKSPSEPGCESVKSLACPEIWPVQRRSGKTVAVQASRGCGQAIPVETRSQ